MKHTKPYYTAGQKTKPPKYTVNDPCHNQLQMIYILEGELVLYANDETTRLGPGDVLLLRVGCEFRYTCPTNGYTGLFFVAADDKTPAFTGPAVAIQSDGRMQQIAEMMANEIQQPVTGSDQMVLALGRMLTWLAIRRYETLDAFRNNFIDERHWAENVRSALLATLHTGRSPRNVLASLNLSYRQLSRHFESGFNMSPKQFQTKARLSEAKNLLANTAMTITDIALDLGYSSSQHFSVDFRRKFGQSPNALRKVMIK